MTTLLIAEDAADIATVLKRIFTRAGLTVLLAGDGQEALELAAEHHPDILLTDLGMPRLDGWGLIEALRGDAELADTPIAILTGQLQPGDARAAESGACAVLLKPCRNDELVAVVDRLAAHGPHRHGDGCPIPASR